MLVKQQQKKRILYFQKISFHKKVAETAFHSAVQIIYY
jgi:hypothetical protein